jgi:polyisoprenoid-binding protein YceI
VAAVLIGGFVLYDAFLGETEEASEPITAITLDVETAEENAADTGAAIDSAAGQSESAEDGPALYSISQDNSEATFSLSEVLRGSPVRVVGTTNQVAGEIAVDLNDLSSVQVGPIQVNARTLATDEDRRNQAIRNRILFTDSYEYITFTPAEIIGLSGSAVPGQELTFEILGDLTIRDITQQVTFAVTALVDGEGQLVGTAETVVNRADFDLNIPSVPFVADVGEEVTLALSFMAVAVS